MASKGAEQGLYHISLLKNYIEYVEKNYPEISIDELLEYAGITRYQQIDPGYWCTQEQSDRFHEILDKKTQNPNISREVGRYAAISSSYGTIRKYIFGFIKPSVAYARLEKICTQISKGMSYSIQMLGPNKMLAISTPTPGTEEKQYQCDNRMGLLEALAKPFIGDYASIEHTECVHKGGRCCKYYITWHEPKYIALKRAKNIYSLLSTITLTVFLLVHFGFYSSSVFLANIAFICGWSLYSSYVEKKGLYERLMAESSTAEQLMNELNRRYSEAELIHEMGQAISKIVDVDSLLGTIMAILEKNLDFQRGMVLLANTDKSRLVFKAGFGYSSEHISSLKNTTLRLDNPESKGPFVVAFWEKRPYLIESIDDVWEELSDKTKSIVSMLDTYSFICVPIIYEDEPLGVLSVDNTKAMGPPKQSDLNLLMGIAPQIAISIMNARSFERLQASEEKYRDLVESANSIIMRLDTGGRISFVNTYAKEFYGYAHHEMIGREVLGFLMSPIDAEGNDFSLVFADFLKNPEDYRQLINVNILKNGENAWISWSNKAVFDKDGNLSEILCVGSDITERKMAEEEKRKLEMQLQRSQKMEAIGMLAGGVAHDLNNILSGVVSYPEILLMEVPEGSSMRKSLEVIKRSGEKAAAIVQDLLTLARRGVNISNTVNLNTVIREFIRSPECNRILEYHGNVRCELQLDPDLMNILGSEVHLSKTLMNLMSNAAEAMIKGGVVIVATENRYVDAPVHGYDLIEEGEYAVMTVSDTGVGISPEDLKRIFEPFYSKKVMGRSGTGLGMAVIWSTVKDHQGYIDVRSTVGKGTCFELYFPITRRGLDDTDARDSLDALRGNEKILVIDDVDDQREIARRLLEKLGYTVDVAACGEDAVKYLGESGADLILLDMIMDPGIDGLETYRRILEIRPGQKAIIVSGFSESDRVKETLELGAGSYVKKPYRLHDMARAIRSELDRKP